jgi:hypothetical protein
MRVRFHPAAILATMTALIAFAGYAAWWPNAPISTSDTPSYMRVAADLKHLSLTEFHQRTPGYPLLLLLTGSEQAPTRTLFYATLGIQLVAVLMLGFLLYRLGISRKLTVLFFLIALSPPYIAPSAYAMTESASIFAVMAAFLAAVLWLSGRKWIFLLLFAIAATYAAFVRPTFQMMVPVMGVALLAAHWAGWTAGFRLRRLLASLLIAGALTFSGMGAYSLLNYRRFGHFDTSSMSANSFSSKVASVLEFLPDQYAPLRTVLVKHRDNLITEPFRNHTGQDYIYRAMPDLLKMYGGDRIKALDAVKQASIYLIKAKPFTYVHESMKLVASYWMPNDYDVRGLDHGPGRAASALVQVTVSGVFLLQTIVILGLVLVYVTARIAARGSEPWPLDNNDKLLVAIYLMGLAVVIYTMLVSCFMGVGDNRYRTPTEFIIFINIAIGFTLWGRIIRVLIKRC